MQLSGRRPSRAPDQLAHGLRYGRAPVAQWTERPVSTRLVAGSTPAGGATRSGPLPGDAPGPQGATEVRVEDAFSSGRVDSAAMKRRPGRTPLVIAALAPASLVLVHDLSFLAAYGAQFQAVLRATGHDGRWTSTVTVVTAVSAFLGVVGLARLASLWLQARRLEHSAGQPPTADVHGYLRILVRIWPWLALVAAVLFLGRENLEQAARGAPLPGLEPLLTGPGIPPFLVLASVTFVLSALGALLVWGHATLAAKIAAARRTSRPRPARRASRPPADPTWAISPVLALNLGRRAPPVSRFS